MEDTVRVQIKTVKDFDRYYGIIKEKNVEPVDGYFLNIWNTVVSVAYKVFSWLKGIIYQPIPKSLNTLTIGALNQITGCEVPSQVMNIIFADLGIRKMPSFENYVKLFFIWNKQIQQIEKLFNDTVINDTTGNGIHNKISSQLHINPFAVLIDQIARRFSITLNEANKLSWVDVYYSLMIDKQDYLIERAINKQAEADMRRQSKR